MQRAQGEGARHDQADHAERHEGATAAYLLSHPHVADYIEEGLERLLDGTVEAVNQSTISAQTAGRVTAIHFDVNDVVPAGAGSAGGVAVLVV